MTTHTVWTVPARVMAYSADPNRYRPMCRSCHKKMDAARRRAELLAARGVTA